LFRLFIRDGDNYAHVVDKPKVQYIYVRVPCCRHRGYRIAHLRHVGLKSIAPVVTDQNQNAGEVYGAPR
jgi:hypothetical protein